MAACQASLSPTISRSLPKFMSTECVMPSNHLILCCLLLLPWSLAATESFPMCQPFISGGQNTGASVSASVLPMSTQGWFPLRLTGLISLQSKRFSRVFSSTTVQRHQFFSHQPSLQSNSNICTWLLGKPYLWLYGPLLAKWCLCFLICCL